MSILDVGKREILNRHVLKQLVSSERFKLYQKLLYLGYHFTSFHQLAKCAFVERRWTFFGHKASNGSQLHQRKDSKLHSLLHCPYLRLLRFLVSSLLLCSWKTNNPKEYDGHNHRCILYLLHGRKQQSL